MMATGPRTAFSAENDDRIEALTAVTAFSSQSRGLDMSHRSWHALFFILASFAIFSVARADQPNADDPAETAAKAKRDDAAEAAAKANADDAAAAAALIAKANAAAAKTSKPAADKSQSLTTIVVNGGPSADILRSARNAGFTIKIADGKTHFCKSEAPIGTRFVSENCMNEKQVTLWLERAQEQRDYLKHVIGAPANSH
jgi:hypothetical protein